MSVLRFFVRSFHPLSNFGVGGLGFHGDNRGFSHDEGVTSRIYAIVQVNLVNGEITSERLGSDPSVSLFGLITQDYADPDTWPKYTLFGGSIDPYRPDGDQGAQVSFAYTGQNFAMPGGNTEWGREHIWESTVPGIDVMVSLGLEIDRDDGRMFFTFRMVGDGFPNAEAFILQGSEALMLATHRRIGSALYQLRGDRRIAMASTGAEVDFPGDMLGPEMEVHWCFDYATVVGAQIDVLEETGKTPHTRPAWNEMHTERDAEGGWARYAVGDTMPTYVPGRRGSSMP
ncbi:hypothetical protein ACG74X_21185 [Marivita sp. S0852]|uniref:hypothetical protein n=1 Tax=Marivita sp. S0852 TaxID=3373893 RepID=UPI0039824D70